MVNRKKIGNEYEKMLCDLFSSLGYWCHNFAYGVNGQPCDIIAIKGEDKHFLIDVKHCDGDVFSFSRIEPNQRGCFKFAKYCGIMNTGFAIWFKKENKFKWLSYWTLEVLEGAGKVSVKSDSLYDLGDIL